MVNVNELRFCLQEMNKTYDTKRVRDTIETLLKIHRNILFNQYNLQYRKIKIQNPAFYKKVWSLYSARQFMMKCGWLEVREVFVFNNDEYLDDIVGTLLNHRFVAPADHEWKEECKFENVTDPQLREVNLRRKAALEREKELEEFRKEKAYRDQLAKTVKLQIAEDRNRRREVFTQPVVGNKLNKGAKVRNIHSQPLSDYSTSRRLGGDSSERMEEGGDATPTQTQRRKVKSRYGAAATLERPKHSSFPYYYYGKSYRIW